MHIATDRISTYAFPLWSVHGAELEPAPKSEASCKTVSRPNLHLLCKNNEGPPNLEQEEEGLLVKPLKGGQTGTSNHVQLSTAVCSWRTTGTLVLYLVAQEQLFGVIGTLCCVG